jgi:hypothetical protein
MKKIFLILALLVSASSFATTQTITKNARPSTSIICSGCSSYSTMGLLSTDFPAGTLPLKKTITSVQYKWYPFTGSGITGQQAFICYDTPYQGTRGNCTEITSSQTGTTTFYNTFQFDNGSTFYIKHTVFGTPTPPYWSPSSTLDQIVITYTY